MMDPSHPALASWNPPPTWSRIRTIDAHTGGEPLRVIVDGYPAIPGETMLARRAYLRQELDHLRRSVMWEPRGHADMYGCLIVPPVNPGSLFGVLFMHNEGYSTMCGHGIIAVVRVALLTGLVPVREPATTVTIDTPAGVVHAEARVRDGEVVAISFRNVPSFVLMSDFVIDVAGIGSIRCDIAFGGAFYAFVGIDQVALQGRVEESSRLIDMGMRIKHAVMKALAITHPLEPDLSFLYGTIFVAPSRAPGVHSRHVCVFAEGQIDRSPTGTGVSARLAIEHQRRKLNVGEKTVIESITGSRFGGTIRELTTCGSYSAIVPEVDGMAYVCGKHEFLFDPSDPFKEGFFIR